jgi:hypothetical protein
MVYMPHSFLHLHLYGLLLCLQPSHTVSHTFYVLPCLVPPSQYERTEASLAEVSSQREALEGRARERRAAALRVMEHMLAGSDEAAARSALLSWQVAAMRQVCGCLA